MVSANWRLENARRAPPPCSRKTNPQTDATRMMSIPCSMYVPGILYLEVFAMYRHTYLDVFSERARLAPPWPLKKFPAEHRLRPLLAGPFQLFFAFSTFFVPRPFSHFFRFVVSSFLLFRLCLYVKPAANN